MAADEGMFGHPEAAAPEEDETHSSPTHTPPAEASPGQMEKAASSLDIDTKKRDTKRYWLS